VVDGLEPLPRGLIAMCGPVGAGKSTLAQVLWPGGVVDVAAIRLGLGALSDASTAARGFRLAYRELERRLRVGELAVLDSTFVTPAVRLSVQLIGRRLGVPAHVVVVNTPLEVGLERNALRPDGWRVPERSARLIFELFRVAREAVVSEDWESVRFTTRGFLGGVL
jgi:predicted kinase